MLAEARPVLSSDYIAQLQVPQVQVTSDDRLLRAAEWSAGALSTIKEQIETIDVFYGCTATATIGILLLVGSLQ